MSRPPVDPDLAAVTAALLAAGATFVVIGGFAVIANDFVRATEDVDFLIPDDDANDRALDAALAALDARWLAPERPYAAGDLAGREHRRLWTHAGLVDELREIHGGLPIDPLPGLDSWHSRSMLRRFAIFLNVTYSPSHGSRPART
ncbi:MAG TPA: hypothetical protein VFF79_17370 [Conexibacter sp.]|jgi:hypothetical protein|nr:hypothetical protein [Conexibacter sp.]